VQTATTCKGAYGVLTVLERAKKHPERMVS
jgi:hypothetical protein